MIKIKTYIFNKLADLVFKITQSSYYKAQNAQKYIKNFKSLGNNCVFDAETSIVNAQYISIGDNFKAEKRLKIDAIDHYRNDFFSPEILIGKNVTFINDIHIGAINKIVIGNGCLVASRVYISDHSHGEITKEALKIRPIDRPLVSKGKVVIGENVWIGEGAAILPNVTIGDNCIIGANAVVTKSVPANAIVAGVPASVIKLLNDDLTY